MATYNGAEYLKYQLESFLGQTHQPDELVVCDDMSSDETVKILHEFRATAPFHVLVMEREKKRRIYKEFRKSHDPLYGRHYFPERSG